MRGSATVLVSLLALAPGTPSLAQAYPTKPIKAITAVGPGGTSDIFIRLIGDELHKRWGQPVIVEMHPGGNMTIGGRSCAEAPNDGHTRSSSCLLTVALGIDSARPAALSEPLSTIVTNSAIPVRSTSVSTA